MQRQILSHHSRDASHYMLLTTRPEQGHRDVLAAVWKAALQSRGEAYAKQFCLNQPGSKGKTPLMLASRNGCVRAAIPRLSYGNLWIPWNMVSRILLGAVCCFRRHFAVDVMVHLRRNAVVSFEAGVSTPPHLGSLSVQYLDRGSCDMVGQASGVRQLPAGSRRGPAAHRHRRARGHRPAHGLRGRSQVMTPLVSVSGGTASSLSSVRRPVKESPACLHRESHQERAKMMTPACSVVVTWESRSPPLDRVLGGVQSVRGANAGGRRAGSVRPPHAPA